MQRGTALKYLRSIGVQTIEVKPVNSFLFGDTNRVVVYTNSLAHDGHGKRVMTVADAVNQYGNCVASRFYENSTMTIKYLQIGKRRFTLYYKKADNELSEGNLVNVIEQQSDYNRLIGIPIFSIDYIQADGIMLATDFNEVENLARLGMDKIIDDYNVIDEVKRALITYNKI